MKKSILLASIFSVFSASATDISGMFNMKEKNFMCGGRNAPSHSPIFGKIDHSNPSNAMATLSAKTSQIRTISNSDKNNISKIYMEAKSNRDFTVNSKKQYDQLGGHYNKNRGTIGQKVYSSTSNGLNETYKLIANQANESVYAILGQIHNVKIFNKQRRVGYTNLDVLNMCQMYWY
jgi:hypothetical protein